MILTQSDFKAQIHDAASDDLAVTMICDYFGADAPYQEIPMAQVEKAMRRGTCIPTGYIPEIYDCDDNARGARDDLQRWAVRLIQAEHPQAPSAAWAHCTAIGGGHSWALFVCEDDHEVWVLDPVGYWKFGEGHLIQRYQPGKRSIYYLSTA